MVIEARFAVPLSLQSLHETTEISSGFLGAMVPHPSAKLGVWSQAAVALLDGALVCCRVAGFPHTRWSEDQGYVVVRCVPDDYPNPDFGTGSESAVRQTDRKREYWLSRRGLGRILRCNDSDSDNRRDHSSREETFYWHTDPRPSI